MTQIISRPNVNGPPVITHNTSRSYTRHPAGSMPSGDGFGGEPKSVAGSVAHPSDHDHLPADASLFAFADPARSVAGVNTLPAFSENTPSLPPIQEAITLITKASWQNLSHQFLIKLLCMRLELSLPARSLPMIGARQSSILHSPWLLWTTQFLVVAPHLASLEDSLQTLLQAIIFLKSVCVQLRRLRPIAFR